MGRGRRYRIETVYGEPYHIGKRKLIPKARIVSLGRARGSVGLRSLSGWGYGIATITPLGIVEETDEGERSIAVVDATRTATWVLLGSAVALTMIFTTIRWLAQRWCRPGG
jgi:hypothetical protein